MKLGHKLIEQQEQLSFVLDGVREVLESLHSLRDELDDKAWEELDDTPVGNLLDSLADLEYEVEKAEK
tara:strand:+ start:299 stop:502 length:204 start_codon:yes stop_codon:yes gene_type:complete